MNRVASEIYAKIRNGQNATPGDIESLLAGSAPEEIYELAAALRKMFHGSNVELCSIINARAGLCSEDCKWCAQSAHNSTGFTPSEMVSAIKAAGVAARNISAGVKKFSLVTSGRRLHGDDFKHMVSVCRELKKIEGLNVCASMGLLSMDELSELRAAGVTRYHCNLETSPSFFNELCTTHTFEDKLNTIRCAKEAGMSVCSGGIIGMGESPAQRVELAFALQRAGADSIPLNILQPISGTPLENSAPLRDEEIMLSFALFRIINPRAVIRFAAGRGGILHLQERLLEISVSGAITGGLLTTSGINMEEDIRLIRSCGYVIC